MTALTLTKTKMQTGLWQGVLSGSSEEPRISVTHLGRPVENMRLQPGKEESTWVLEITIPRGDLRRRSNPAHPWCDNRYEAGQYHADRRGSIGRRSACRGRSAARGTRYAQACLPASLRRNRLTENENPPDHQGRGV